MDSDFKKPTHVINTNPKNITKDDTYQTPSNINPTKIKKHTGLKVTLIIIIIFLLAGLGYGIWYHSSTKNDEIKIKNAQIKSLQTQLSKSKAENKILTSKLAASGVDTTSNTSTSTPTGLSQADKENIIASITSGNTAALEQKMNTSVLVILAASEGMGQRTPAQAVSDLSYVTSVQQPWDFNPTNATLTKYQTGGYAQYFPNGAIIGTAADGKVVSFTVNADGKITTVFMSSSAELL